MSIQSFNPQEASFAFLHQQGVFVVIVAIHLRRSPSLTQLQNALDQLQDRHACLRYHRHAKLSTKYWRDGAERIPCRLKILEEPSDWQTQAMDWLKTPLQDLNKPYLAAELCQCAQVNEAILLLKADHAFFDGLSLITLIEQLDQILRQDSETSALTTLSHSFWREVPWQGPRLPKRKASKVPWYNESLRVPAGKRESRGLFFSLSAELSQLIKKISRLQGLSLHDTVSAAFLWSLRELWPEDRELVLSTNINLRPYCEPSLPPHHIGSVVSHLVHELAFPQQASPWELARELSQARQASLARDEHRQNLGRNLRFYERWLIRRVVPHLRNGRISSVNISNMGQTKAFASRDSLVSGLHIFTSQHRLGSLIQLSFLSLAEELQFSLIYTLPLLQKSEVEGVRQRFFSKLQEIESWQTHTEEYPSQAQKQHRQSEVRRQQASHTISQPQA